MAFRIRFVDGSETIEMQAPTLAAVERLLSFLRRAGVRDISVMPIKAGPVKPAHSVDGDELYDLYARSMRAWRR